MAVQQIEAAYGKGSIMKLGERNHGNVPVISTGSLTLDIALGIGGLPRGRVVEIYGPESSGKTTMALHVVAQAQKQVSVAPSRFVDDMSIEASIYLYHQRLLSPVRSVANGQHDRMPRVPQPHHRPYVAGTQLHVH